MSPAQRRLMEFVETCVQHPWKVDDQEVEELHEHGFNDEQIAEAALNVALFLALTTMADVYGLGDSGFHLKEIEPQEDPRNDEIIEQDLEDWKAGV